MLDLDTTGTSDVRSDTILEVTNIEVIYNHVILVLKGVSLNVEKGRITALLGGNGAGKTTTLKAISNLLHSERGEVTKGQIGQVQAARTVAGSRIRRQAGQERRDPGDGGAPLFRASDGGGQPSVGRLYADAMARAAIRGRSGDGL